MAQPFGAALVVSLMFSTIAAASQAAAPFTATLELPSPAEVIVTIRARCDACAWNTSGREAVVLRIDVGDRYVSHLPLIRTGVGEYRVLIGGLPAGKHLLRIGPDEELTAAQLKHGAARVEHAAFTTIPEGHPEHAAYSFAPMLYARPNTIGRFTDVPAFMWYEREPTTRGVRYRYSVVFTNEDGGTPTDRLMATWGRTTDIEYVYSVELDDAGNVLEDDLQGPDHKILSFAGGTREGRHPLLWVVTDNNMVLPTGSTRVRHAPAPVAFALGGTSREAVMDAHPWLYAVAAQELAREGKIVEGAPPGRGAIPDPRTFIYIEACGTLNGAALTFEAGVRGTWLPSDRGVREYAIVRDGCFRAAVPAPASTRPEDLTGLRILAHPRSTPSAPESEPAAVRIDRVNTVFMLDDGHRPGAPLLRWHGPATVRAGGPPLEIPVGRR